ncbi:hypothetical protein [Mesorhizobium sp. CAU 1732]|uniref:hypothetical protein n=1 Tax=Mesorhizobium sp. CAU 1732 TaxID=3140358 RepID=UPI003260A59B
MKRTIRVSIAVLALTSLEAAANQPPVGIFRCHATDMRPMATLLLDGHGMYQLIAAKGPDFAADPEAPHNGAGTYAIEGMHMTFGSGPISELLDAAGNVLGEGQEATIGIANTKGTVMTCLSTV